MTTLHIPDSVPRTAIMEFVRSQNGYLLYCNDGSLKLVRRPRHSNANVMRFPQRRGQYSSTLPTEPDPAV